MSLVDEVDKRRAARAGGRGRRRRRRRDEPKIKDEKDLQPYERDLRDVDYWKKIGEEYQKPADRHRLGAVQRDVAERRAVATSQEYVDPGGPARDAGSPDLRGAQGLRPAAEVRLHRRPHRRGSSTRRAAARKCSTPPARTRRRCRPTSS